MTSKTLHPIMNGRNVPSQDLLKSLRVDRGIAALVTKLQSDIDYDNTKVIASGIITTDQTGNIKSTHWVTAGSLKTSHTSANRIWLGADKDVQVVFRMKDLTAPVTEAGWCVLFYPQQDHSSWKYHNITGI